MKTKIKIYCALTTPFIIYRLILLLYKLVKHILFHMVTFVLTIVNEMTKAI